MLQKAYFVSLFIIKSIYRAIIFTTRIKD